jgi:tRNA(Ile)-lysidine synthase
MIQSGDTIVIGLSGGPDSVCLLSVLERLRIPFNLSLHAVYFDHGLRPKETPDEIDFCRDLCGSFSISFAVKKIDVIGHAKTVKMSKQESARELRYHSLQEISKTLPAHKIALGHNADDQAETILMRLFRGTGPSGLAGIPPVRNAIIRPLIDVERRHIEQYLDTEGIGFMIDSSNLHDDYLRNRLRLHIMPEVKKLNPDAIKVMSRAADICRDEDRFFDIQVTKILMKLISRKTNRSIELFLTPMENMDIVLLRRTLRRALDETHGLRSISFAHIEELINLIKMGHAGDRMYLPSNRRAIKKYATILITAEPAQKIGIIPFNITAPVTIPESGIVLVPAMIPRNQFTGNTGDGKTRAVFDADKLKEPLVIRSRLPGDVFIPLGMTHRKKIQDFFVDEKIPRDERDIVPLLIAGDRIAWVIGHRIDARFAIDATTQTLLIIDMKPLKI